MALRRYLPNIKANPIARPCTTQCSPVLHLPESTKIVSKTVVQFARCRGLGNWEFFLMRMLFALMLFAAAGAQSAHAGWSKWMDHTSYHSYFNWQRTLGKYPAKVEVGNFDGHIKYRGDFRKLPSGSGFASFRRMSDAQFNAKNSHFTSKGFVLVWHQRMVHDGGVDNVATWFK